MFRTLLFMLLLLTFAPLQALAATVIGKVAAVSGSPVAVSVDGERKLKAGSQVFEDDTIRVTKGNAQIVLNDNTRLVVGPDSRLVLASFAMDDNGTASKIAIKALRGTFRFISGKSPRKAFDIQTAHATIGIRGTGFDFWVKNATGVVVMNGEVKLCAIRDSGACVELEDQCGAGRATELTVTKPLGVQAAELIRDNLPFIENQSMLRRDFRLDIVRCKDVLASMPKGKKTKAK